MKLLLFFPDLKENRVANNWTTLNRRIKEEGFPAGRMIGRRRAWTPAEIQAWIDCKSPANRAPLKGWAKARIAQRDKAGAA